MSAAVAEWRLPFDVAPVVAPDIPGLRVVTIADRFDAFHNANPWIADALERLAGDWLARGHTRVSVKALFEVVRYEHGRTVAQPDQGLRVNNDFTSRYARLLIERRPEWDDAIQTRSLRAA